MNFIPARFFAIVAACVVVATSGCAYKGAKVVEGTDIAVGLDLPAAEGVFKFTAFNYLSGFRLGVDQNAQLSVDYTTEEENEYFGIIKSTVRKKVKAGVTPCVTDTKAE